MDHQWVVSILVGAVGGFFDGMAGYGGVTGVWRKTDELGRTVYDLGTLGNILVGGLVGFLSFALNVADADWAMGPRVGVTAGSLIAGVGASEILKRIRNEQKLKQATRRLGSGVRKTFRAAENLVTKPTEHTAQEPGSGRD